jgi:hypothetical protein
MHAADITKSKRLQDFVAALRTGPKTTRELMLLTNSCAVHSDAAEVRMNGIEVWCAFEGMRAGRRIYSYSLEAPQ